MLRVALLSRVAPPEFDEWFAGMHPDNQERFIEATQNPERLWQILQARANEPANVFLANTIKRFQSNYAKTLPAVIASHELAVKQGPGGWFDDNVAVRTPWGANLNAITAQVKIMHGDQDTAIPMGHALWLAEQLSIEPDIVVEAKHTLPQTKWQEAFQWIVGTKD